MELFYKMIKVIEIILFVWCAAATLYMLVYAIFGLIYHKKNKKKLIHNDVDAPRVAVIIPAYKEDSVIVKTAEAALNQIYPVGKLQVIVVADNLQDITVVKLNRLPIKVIPVSFENSTKSKAINAALNSIPDYFDVVVILDADNIIRPDFIGLIAEAFKQGHKAIQGHRTAKNFNTPTAILDGISEEINNTIFCKGQQYIGMSSRLTGSGMAFDYPLFKELMASINAVGGFDKELELQLILSNAKIHYVPEAEIYDEKVSKSEVLTKQRSRWISSQFHYMKKYLPKGLVELVKHRNVDYFNKSFQLAIPPRVLMILLITIGFGLSMVGNHSTFPLAWIVLLAAYLSVFIIAFPTKFLTLKTLQLVYVLPMAIIKMIFSMPSLFTANKKFIHTPHGV